MYFHTSILRIDDIGVPGKQPTSALCASPITQQDEPVIWTAQEQHLLIAAARSVSIARDRAATMQHLEHLAQTDPLTGLGNRRALDETLQTLEGHAFTLGSSISTA